MGWVQQENYCTGVSELVTSENLLSSCQLVRIKLIIAGGHPHQAGALNFQLGAYMNCFINRYFIRCVSTMASLSKSCSLSQVNSQLMALETRLIRNDGHLPVFNCKRKKSYNWVVDSTSLLKVSKCGTTCCWQLKGELDHRASCGQSLAGEGISDHFQKWLLLKVKSSWKHAYCNCILK